ncbi:MAG: SAM-dependent methyltransferase [Methanobacterium sp. ERen5]|nr:MAG: SAM-dependent methyltransferase [Methanobacterium sp. ERen5]
MTKEAAKTAMGSTFMIAVEQSFPEEQRIITDKLAYPILPLSYRLLVKLFNIKFVRHWIINTTETSTPGLWSGIMLRKLYINHKINNSSSEIGQVVNLGAGYDTMAYTLSSLSNMSVWELDQKGVIETKTQRLETSLGEVPKNVKLLATDFDHEDVGHALKEQGFQEEMPTFFILDAVTQYLDEESVKKMFTFLSQAQTGSKLIFTYVLREFIEGVEMYEMKNLYKKYVFPKIWKFGLFTQDTEEFLEGYGWKLIEDLEADDIHDDYIKPNNRNLKTTNLERIVYAEKI